jgi:hypothetical protein
MIDVVERTWKEAVEADSEVLSQYFLGDTEENHKNR